MLHRHLTLEQYERAVEEGGQVAARLRRQARACPRCAAALVEAPLAPLLAAWELPAAVDRPVDWESALRRAVAPSAQRVGGRATRPMRLVAAVGLLAGLLLATALPAAASTGPNSVLFPLRGAEEETRWRLTPEPDRAALEADLATAYLWQARTSAARHDEESYHASMQRFFTWAERLKTDVRKAPPGQRSSTRGAVDTALSLMSPLAASGPDPAQASRARSIMEDVEAESEGGDERDGGRQGNPGVVCQQPGQPTARGQEGSRSGDCATLPNDSSDRSHDGGESRASGDR